MPPVQSGVPQAHAWQHVTSHVVLCKPCSAALSEVEDLHHLHQTITFLQQCRQLTQTDCSTNALHFFVGANPINMDRTWPETPLHTRHAVPVTGNALVSTQKTLATRFGCTPRTLCAEPMPTATIYRFPHVYLGPTLLATFLLSSPGTFHTIHTAVAATAACTADKQQTAAAATPATSELL
jgi:hypothetical protein